MTNEPNETELDDTELDENGKPKPKHKALAILESITVKSLGLVHRGSVPGSEFFIIKSIDGKTGDTDMKNYTDEVDDTDLEDEDLEDESDDYPNDLAMKDKLIALGVKSWLQSGGGKEFMDSYRMAANQSHLNLAKELGSKRQPVRKSEDEVAELRIAKEQQDFEAYRLKAIGFYRSYQSGSGEIRKADIPANFKELLLKMSKEEQQLYIDGARFLNDAIAKGDTAVTVRGSNVPYDSQVESNPYNNPRDVRNEFSTAEAQRYELLISRYYAQLPATKGRLSREYLTGLFMSGWDVGKCIKQSPNL